MLYLLQILLLYIKNPLSKPLKQSIHFESESKNQQCNNCGQVSAKNKIFQKFNPFGYWAVQK